MTRARSFAAVSKLSLALVLGIYLSATPTRASAATPTITPLFSFSCPAQQFTTCPQGYRPNALIQASDGNFYGAAQLTTSGTSDPQGGTLFKITPAGQFTLLFTFAPNQQGNYLNGDQPASGLVEGNDGFLYGTTIFGGQSNEGVLFRIAKTGQNFQVLHSFCSASNCADGSFPGGLVLGHDGQIYGTAVAGGSTGYGTIFRFIPSTGLTTLFTFNGTTQGASPGGMTQGTDGNFYGVAGFRVFRFGLSGSFSIINSFPFGEFVPPTADSGLLQASNGKLYGGISTYAINQVQFYSLGTSGSGFDPFPEIGTLAVDFSVSTPIQASDGNLWATFTSRSESNGTVTAFSPTTGAVVHDIPFNGTNGATPTAGLVQGADGKLYGTAAEGGKGSVGTVWVINGGLPAPKASIAAFGAGSAAPGATVLIRGDHFIGTTAVEFNGVKATFKVLNRNFISAVVPAGATTGTISVTNSGGTTTSNNSFTVE